LRIGEYLVGRRGEKIKLVKKDRQAVEWEKKQDWGEEGGNTKKIRDLERLERTKSHCKERPDRGLRNNDNRLGKRSAVVATGSKERWNRALARRSQEKEP